MSSWLSHDFTVTKIQKALFQMYPSKSLGLDGLPALFFEKYWEVIENSLVSKCLGVLNHGSSAQGRTQDFF